MKKGSFLSGLIALVVALCICAHYMPDPKKITHKISDLRAADDITKKIEEEAVALDSGLGISEQEYRRELSEIQEMVDDSETARYLEMVNDINVNQLMGQDADQLLSGDNTQNFVDQFYQGELQTLQILSEIEGCTVEELLENADMSETEREETRQQLKEALLADEELLALFGEEELKWLLEMDTSN